jgi:hypothetical protein
MTDYSETDVILRSRAANPFNQWSDWYGTESEAVVTFVTIKEELWNQWNNQCVDIIHEDCDHQDMQERINCDNGERIVKHDNFDKEEVREPGIYSDGTNYEDEDKVDESYTIIVPYDFLSPKLCRHWIDKLNQDYDRCFDLDIDESQEKASPSVDEVMGANRISLE